MRFLFGVALLIICALPQMVIAGEDSVFQPDKYANTGPSYVTEQQMKNYVEKKLNELDLGPSGPTCDWTG